jgi:stage II sporulation protein D
MITGDKLVKKDRTEYTLSNILPSAFFCFDKLSNNIQNGDTQNMNVINGIMIYGAGMGHGAGMSQNGAKNLAAKGFTVSEILAYYYNADVRKVCK